MHVPVRSALFVIAALAPLHASAAPSPDSIRSVLLEIEDGPRTLSVELALTDDDRPREVKLSDGAVSYELQVRCLRPDGDDPVVILDIRRTARPDGARQSSSLSLKLSGRVAVGERVIMSELKGAAGDTLVAVTLKS